jgi:hypothetical protein
MIIQIFLAEQFFYKTHGLQVNKLSYPIHKDVKLRAWVIMSME